ncbi:hypothetical protein ACLOJK_020095 [Asimina triloba]
MTTTARQSRQGSGGDWRVARQSRAAGGGPVVGLVRQSSRARAEQQSTSTSRVPLGNEAEHEHEQEQQSTSRVPLGNEMRRARKHEKAVAGPPDRRGRGGQGGKGKEGKRGITAGKRVACRRRWLGRTAADDDGTAGKRRMASSTPNALQPCRIGNEREVGEGSGAAVRRCLNEMGAVGAAASGWARATADEGQRGIGLSRVRAAIINL